MSYSDRPRRQGFTILELLAVVTISSVLLLTISTLLVATLRMSGRTTGGLARQQIVMRLANQWRDDVHASSKVAIEQDNDDMNIALTLSSHRRVDYRAAGDVLYRSVTRDGKQISSDEFRMGKNATIQFLQRDRSVSLVVMPEQSRSAGVIKSVAPIHMMATLPKVEEQP